jgi:F-type H+-transporting ATPase subunit gamma
MATLRDIRRRIVSVKSTQQITRAMKLVAAAKLRRAQERILEARPYANTMDRVVGGLVSRVPRGIHPLLAEHPPSAERPPRRLLIAVSGDRGLCGAFNTNIIRRSLEVLREVGETGVDLALILVGRKVRDFHRRRDGAKIRSEYTNFFDKLAFRHAVEIARDAVAAFTGGEADEVFLLYNEFRSVASQRVVVSRLLPVEPPKTDEADTTEFRFEPSPEAVLARLLPRHVEVQVYRALMESVAAEYGARMTAMDNATKNASEMIDLLTLQFNKARQERITKELLEIVGGAEALRHSG